MSPYLLIALLGSSPLLEVQSSEDGVLSETLFNLQLRLLHTTFLLEPSLFLLALFVSGLIIRKQVELLWFFLPDGKRVLRHHMISRQVQPSNEQVRIDDAIEELCRPLHDEP